MNSLGTIGRTVATVFVLVTVLGSAYFGYWLLRALGQLDPNTVYALPAGVPPEAIYAYRLNVTLLDVEGRSASAIATQELFVEVSYRDRGVGNIPYNMQVRGEPLTISIGEQRFTTKFSKDYARDVWAGCVQVAYETFADVVAAVDALSVPCKFPVPRELLNSVDPLAPGDKPQGGSSQLSRQVTASHVELVPLTGRVASRAEPLQASSPAEPTAAFAKFD